MIKLTPDNLYAVGPQHGITHEDIGPFVKELPARVAAVQTRGQGFYEIINDTENLAKIQAFAKENHDKYDHFVILGIGGSALGALCLQQSLTHLYKTPKLHILDNIDPVMLREIEDIIALPKTLFIVITKSGSTPETLAQYFYFRKKCDDAGLPAANHFLFITDPQKGSLRAIAQEEKIPTFEIPENVGGRFSVLTAVGLVPAALMGLNIEKLLEGAKSMRVQFFSEDPHENLPYQIAAIQTILSKKGKNINVIMPYAQKLIRFADWYRQLLAESIGKKFDRNNNEVQTGITPVNALGATDQHSQSQLYNEGPNDKLHIFLKISNMGEDISIPSPTKTSDESLQYLHNVTFTQLIHTELQGTAQALTQNQRPNLTLEINELNEYTLGELFMLFEGATALLGEMLNINAYDQPGVELSKQITKTLLSPPSS